jgi:hypothetical protein
MTSRKLLAEVALLAGVLFIGTAWSSSGGHGTSGNSASFGNGSTLESLYINDGSDEPVPVCHVLFVPQWDPARVNHGFSYVGGGDVREYSFNIGYREQDVQQFEAKPVRVIRRFLFADVFEGGGHRFDLADGNIFVVAVHRNGSQRVTQVPRLEGSRQSDEILTAVKKALPNDARVQALRHEGHKGWASATMMPAGPRT